MYALACFFLLGTESQQALGRFPPLPVVDQQIAAADAYLAWLGARLHFQTWQTDSLREHERACWRARQCWYALRNAQTTESDTYRGHCLDELLRLVGAADFYAGRLPWVLPFCAGP